MLAGFLKSLMFIGKESSPDSFSKVDVFRFIYVRQKSHTWFGVLPGNSALKQTNCRLDQLKARFYRESFWDLFFNSFIEIRKWPGWWFQIIFIFIPTWGNDPIWLIFFKGVETTNQFIEQWTPMFPSFPNRNFMKNQDSGCRERMRIGTGRGRDLRESLQLNT